MGKINAYLHLPTIEVQKARAVDKWLKILKTNSKAAALLQYIRKDLINRKQLQPSESDNTNHIQVESYTSRLTNKE